MIEINMSDLKRNKRKKVEQYFGEKGFNKILITEDDGFKLIAIA